jgi:UTP-glucose-1-phosphate uridylyltransferase
MSQKVRKAVIPAAGFGTRFLPQTKAMPKEMLPIVDKPIIQLIVEELVSAGIEDIVIVTGSHKRSIEDHFDRPSLELQENLLLRFHPSGLPRGHRLTDRHGFKVRRVDQPKWAAMLAV